MSSTRKIAVRKMRERAEALSPGDSIESAMLDQKARGWEWIAEQVAVLREKSRAEAARLLGPDRGE